MNSHIWKCSQCNKYTKMNIKDDIIDINCNCRYHFTMSIKKYINDSKKEKIIKHIKDDALKDITTKIGKAEWFILTYFKEIKEEHISRLIAKINELESSYEESSNRNKNILKCLNILINNYDGSNEMKKIYWIMRLRSITVKMKRILMN